MHFVHLTSQNLIFEMFWRWCGYVWLSKGVFHSQHVEALHLLEAYVEVDATLPFADEQGEYMLWKKAVMALLCQLC